MALGKILYALKDFYQEIDRGLDAAFTRFDPAPRWGGKKPSNDGNSRND